MKSLVLCALSLLATLHGALAQDADEMLYANWDRIAHALAGPLLDRETGGPVPDSEFVAGLVDLNYDGQAEVLAFRDPATCSGSLCGQFAFALTGDGFVQVLPAIDAIRVSPSMDVGLGSFKRGGYIDMRYGSASLSWNGSAYVESSTLPAPTLDGTRFLPACAGLDANDWAFESAGVSTGQGREETCGCFLEQAGAVGFDQAGLDRYVDYLGTLETGTPQESDTAFTAVGQSYNTIDDIFRGCLVSKGWTTWTGVLSEYDEKEPQQPLEAAPFIRTCEAQDWLTGHRKVGTPDRALAMCGCLMRKLAARGYDQAALDGVQRFYAAEIGEDELVAIRAEALNETDGDLDMCLGRLPAR